jgi:hypothetical protein
VRKEPKLFAEVFKEITGHRVRVCTLEGPVNGVVERVSDDAVVLRPDAAQGEILLNPMWIISVKRLED